ncbi:MAG: polysaccharide deacetylase family protein [Peptostreptococcaceae bacterium]
MSKLTFSSKKKRSKTKLTFSSNNKCSKSKILVLLTICIIGFVGIKTTSLTINYANLKKEEIELQKRAKEIMLEEEKEIEQKELKERLKEEQKIVGIKDDFKEFSYDAKIIQRKVNTNDFYNNGEKIVFLTFDDGTSTTVTPRVLDTLKEHDVKATFFLTGMNILKHEEASRNLVNRIFDEGHAIGNHSFTHDYSFLYPDGVFDLDNFKEDFGMMDNLLNEILGENFETRIVRMPGGAMSWQGMDILYSYLEENNMASIDWNALIRDAEGHRKNAPELFKNAVDTSKGKEMVVLLMHDMYGKEETANALDDIIRYYKDMGYEFKTLS